MQPTERVTVVLKAREGESLAQHIAPFISLGATVLVGRHGAVVTAASEGDQIEEAQQLEQQLLLAEAALTRAKAVFAGWTDVQTLEFCSLALRHVVVEGDLSFSDVNDGLRCMAEKGQPAFVRPFDIDEHVKLVADARRYQWLRNVAWDTPRQDLTLRDRHQNMLIEQDLDSEIDCAMRAYPGSADHDEEWNEIPEATFAAMKAVADHHPIDVPPEVDPRDLFIDLNPIGASGDELQKGRNSFVDDRTHGDYLIFLAGYMAAQEVQS